MYKLLTLYRNVFSNIQPNIWILSIAMFINRSGSMVLLFTSLYLTKDLHFSIAEAGIALSFYGIGSVLGSYAGGWLTDRIHFFNIMFFSLISSGLILLLLLIATSPFFISFIIFAYAFAADIFRPANSKAIAVYSTPENRTRSVSLVRLAINLGFSIGPALGGFTALYLGYKWLFVIDACSGFLAAAMLFFYLPRQAAVQENTSDKVILNDKSTSAYRDKPYLFFTLLVALYGVCFFQLFASIPQYFSEECHYNEDTIGLLLALNGLLVVLIEMPLVAAFEKNKNMFGFIIAGVWCIPVALGVLYLGKGILIFAILYTLIITMSEILAMPFMMNYALSRPVKERQGQYSALYSIAYGLANIFAPLLGLGIADKYGFGTMFFFFIGLSLLTVIGFWVLKKRAENNP
jgi:predicted MFS family arabinose efflux permease